MLLAVSVLEAILFNVSKLAGVQEPNVSTANGKKRAPLAETWLSYLQSFTISPFKAAEPAEYDEWAGNFGLYIYIYTSLNLF